MYAFHLCDNYTIIGETSAKEKMKNENRKGIWGIAF